MFNSILEMLFNIFIKLLQCLGILPYKDYHKNGTRELLLLAKNLTLMVAIVLYGLSGIYFGAVYIYTDFGNMYLLVDVFKNIVAIFSSISFIPAMLFRQPKWILLLDAAIRMKSNLRKYRKLISVLMLYIVIVHIFIIVTLTSARSHTRFQNLLEHGELFLTGMNFMIKFPLVAYYFENLSIVIMIVLLLKINDKLAAMQTNLRQLEKFQFRSMTTIKHSKRLYLSAMKLKVLINDYFGLKLLTIYANSTVRLLWFFILSIQMWNPDKFAINLIFDWTHWAASVVFGILGLVPACVITMTCHAVAKKADFLLEDCYRLRYKFSYESYEHRELLALTTYMSENRLVFTAVDYFIIRPSVLLGVIGSSTTYFIAIIQFN